MKQIIFYYECMHSSIISRTIVFYGGGGGVGVWVWGVGGGGGGGGRWGGGGGVLWPH